MLPPGSKGLFLIQKMNHLSNGVFLKDFTEIFESYQYPVGNSRKQNNVKLVQNQQEKHQSNVIDVVLVSLLLTLNIFHTLL